MVKFKEVTLSDGMVKVSGPIDNSESVKHLIFMIGQGEETVHHHALEWSGDTWTGEVDADGLNSGPAVAVGIAVSLGEGPPPSYETFTWSQVVTIEEAQAGETPAA